MDPLPAVPPPPPAFTPPEQTRDPLADLANATDMEIGRGSCGESVEIPVAAGAV